MKTTTSRFVLSLTWLATAVLAGCGGDAASSSASSKGTAGGTTAGGATGGKQITLTNVSYDPTREFYDEFNRAFAKFWKEKTGDDVKVDQSHAGSSKQARAVIDGLQADVVTLGLAYDINVIAEKAQLLSPDWQKLLPNNSSPYTSTIVFLVRKGNPKQIKDWDDLVKGDVSIITPNPKTSGGARWNFLAAWGFALKKELGDFKKLRDPAAKAEVGAAQAKAKEFVTDIYHRVPVLDSGARGSTNTFVQNGQGDVLLAWENEAYLAVNEAKKAGNADIEIVVPSISILAEPPVAVVDKVAAKHGTAEVAKAYLQYLYSPEGQHLAAKHYFRPSNEESTTPEEKKRFAPVELFTLDEVFGDWNKTQKAYFDDGGVFDQIYQPGK